MPTSYLKTLSEKGKGSVPELEKQWEKAKADAKAQGQADNWAYVTGIFKRRIGASAFSDNWMDNEDRLAAVDPVNQFATETVADVNAEHRLNAAAFLRSLPDQANRGACRTALFSYLYGRNTPQEVELALMRRQVYAGRESGKGAGIFFYCPGTDRFLMVKRSAYGDEAESWATLGGGVDEGEEHEEAALREALEEGRFIGEVELIPMYTSYQEDFKYYNFLGIVEEEFTPVLNEEHTDYGWFYADDFPQPILEPFQDALNESPIKQHFGF
ncbi:A/G-specific adenine glycosylase [Achromobacter phage Motura]|uniref:A/G-specific adenine glycosylase n=1 Tax=Achromobacter phage Motura TaxID=2591403 RepID=A0A514CSY5_9CAUD|nr:A/G-specific adenine glycosylase [Achromobacter phage Motura]QDH83582.1 A/G-specific adenine glycosylase [Achromobacter phage Motura]